MTAARVAVLLVGIVVLMADAYSVLTVLIVPRAANSVVTYPMVVVRALFRQMALPARRYATKDHILALSEPVALIVVLTTWLCVAVVGFTLVNWGIGVASFTTAFSEAGSSVFTLGFVLTTNEGSRVVDFVAAGTGMVLVALQIAYLPTLYAAYNRRETMVTLLQSRAGAPAWGPELLIRHQLVDTVDNLPSLFADWERWAADVAESHSTYPSLLYLRSPRSLNSWIVSLMAVLDAAALILSVDPDGAPIEARMCIRMGFTCLRDVARAIHVQFDPDPSPDDPITLPEEEFVDACARLTAVGFSVSRPIDQAWAHFRGWRVNYEAVGYAVAARLNAPPALWTGPRHLFRGESLQPRRPVDRRPGGFPPGPGAIPAESVEEPGSD
ncbi:MAG: hypothetical protein ABSF84_16905 [Acidimicrobiales bacterium]|jgi:hypothetical protein